MDMFEPIGMGGFARALARTQLPGGAIPRGEERLGLAGLAVQATGLNLRAETTLNLLNRVAEESGFLKRDGTPVETWADLEPHQKKDLSKNEQLAEELELRSEIAVERRQLNAIGFASLDDIDEERIIRGEALVTEFFDEQHTPNAFRDEVTLLKREMSARKAQVDIDFQLFKKTDELPSDPNKRALVQYYETFDKATREPSRTMDWEKQEKLEAALRKSWTSTQEAYVDDNTGLTEWGPLMTGYNQAVKQLEPYWETREDLRLNYRRLHPEIDVILVIWYGYKPQTTAGEAAQRGVQSRTPAPQTQEKSAFDTILEALTR
jgi:hypothetical protein